MPKINVNLLRPHPRNKEFFDDMEGDKWKDFVESIKTSGIIQPLIVTDDYVVISGHQRLKAAKELGLTEVPCEIRKYADKDGITAEDWKLNDLIETNIKQRGMGNTNPMKAARCYLELERIHGVQRGGYRGGLQNLGGQSAIIALSSPKSFQQKIAEEAGISIRQYKNTKKLNDLIKPLQDLVEKKNLKPTIATNLAYLDQEDQWILYNVFGESIGEIMQTKDSVEIRKELDELRKQSKQNEELRLKAEREKVELERQKLELEEKIKNIKPEIIEKEPDDYQELKDTLKTIKEQSEQLTKRLNELEQEKNRLDELRKKAIDEKRQALEEKARAEAEIKNIKYELEQVKQQYGLEAKKQCELADKLIEETKKVIANATSILELMDIEQLPDYKYNDFSTTLIIFIDKLEKVYRSAEQKSKNGKVAFFRKRDD
ncbi:ParB N-terminal domain-containing protein [Thermoanaerobacterium thermosaccharolyticum]|uniref:ParB/RepB/Spo0J family partition protein n=1 Tax=Thermoanaerobacterium thermosaccharolyticum TaxID=1517 RepID=UPI003D2B8BFD